MKRPGVLAIGGCLVIKIEETAIIMESIKTIESAIGLLVAYYFILDAAYPDALLNVFFFFGTCLPLSGGEEVHSIGQKFMGCRRTVNDIILYLSFTT